MRASIVIVTYGQRDLTAQCLRSLERCLGDRLGQDWELVLVDNNSPDDTPQLLRSWSDRAIVKLLPANRNFAGGCNAGAAEAHGEVLIFLNSDTEVTPGGLETLAEQALEPGVSAAGCRLLFPDGTLQHAGVAFLHGEALDGAAMPQHVFHHQDQSLPGANACFELDAVTAACIAVRATTFHAVGGFDEGYLNGLEDIDLCLRLRETGERIVYRGDVTIVHHEGASRGKGKQLWATPARAAAMRSNDLRFVGAWMAKLDQDDGLAAQLWDAALENRPPPRISPTGEIVVLGQPGGIGPGADEARAILAALEAAGAFPCAGDWPVPIVVPRLSGPMAKTLLAARRRIPDAAAPCLVVPAGAHDHADNVTATIVRLAQPRTAYRIEPSAAVWANSQATANALIEQGLSPERVSVVPSPVLPAPVGPGGQGVLAILPVHDQAAARVVLDALGDLPPGVPVRLLPTVVTRHLADQVAAVLPSGELLGPCSDEARYASLAAGADVVVAIDPADRFERRALVAARVGAAPITACADGPAAAVLSNAVATEPAAVAAAIMDGLDKSEGRAARAAAVAASCSPEAITARFQLVPRLAA